MLQRNQKQVSKRTLILAFVAKSRQLRMRVIIMMALGLVAGVAADELSAAEKALKTAGAKVLRFPADRSVGKLYVEKQSPDSSDAEGDRDSSLAMRVDPARVCLDGDRDFLGPAQGDVVVPADRNIRLSIQLGSGSEGLSGLSRLAPSDLYALHILSWTTRGRANRPRLESISHLTGLQVLSFSNTGIDNRAMSVLKPLSSLRGLALNSERSVGSNGLAVLKDLPALEFLDLDPGVIDAGLEHIGQLRKLRWLRLRMGRIRGPGLAHLANLPRLERLSLWGTTGLTDQHVRYLEGLTRLKSLTLWGNDVPLTDASLASISKLASLEELHLIRLKTDFTDAGVAKLTKMPKLRNLGASPDDASILAGMEQLESVSVIALTSRNMQALARLGNLKSLGLALEAPARGSAVAMLGELKSLEKLHVVSQHVFAKGFSDEELACLESLSRLKHLSIPTKGITERGWASIGRLSQLEHLRVGDGRERNPMLKRGLNHLNGLTKLQTLNFEMDSGQKSIAEQSPIMDDTPLNLKALTNLKSISLGSLCLQESDWAFLADLNQLEDLKLYNCNACSENGLRHIKDLTKLKSLDIQATSLTDGNGLELLGGLKRLDRIRLTGRITDRALGRMPGLPLLQMFDVRTDVPIQPKTIAHLREVLPNVNNVNVQQPSRQGPLMMQPAPQNRGTTRSMQQSPRTIQSTPQRRSTTRTRRRRSQRSPRRINR